MWKINESRHNGLHLAAVFTASVLVTLAFWAILPERFQTNESSDYPQFYEPVARNVLAGSGLTVNYGPATRYPPGYPLFLAGIFAFSNATGIPEHRALEVFILFCAGISSVFIFLLARTIWKLGPALVVSFLWCSYPFGLWLTKQPNSEIPFWTLYYGGVALFGNALLRRISLWYVFFLCGVIVGAAALVRPIAIGVGLVLGLSFCLLRTEKSVRSRLFLAGMLFAGNLLTILPWEAWLYQNTGKIIILSTNGVSSIRDGLTFDLNYKGYRQGIAVPEGVRTVMQDILSLSRSGRVDTLGEVVSVVVREFCMHPLAVAELSAMKVARAWYGTDTGKYEGMILAIQILYLIVVVWGGWNVWKRNECGKKLVVLVVLLTLYFWAMTTLVLSILRYMIPTIGLLFVFIPGSVLPLRMPWKKLRWISGHSSQ